MRQCYVPLLLFDPANLSGDFVCKGTINHPLFRIKVVVVEGPFRCPPNRLVSSYNWGELLW